MTFKFLARTALSACIALSLGSPVYGQDVMRRASDLSAARTRFIDLYQAFTDVPAQGLLGRSELAGLGVLKCGNSSRLMFRPFGNPWGKTQLSGCFGKPENAAKPTQVFLRAFEVWAAHIPMTFKFGPRPQCDIKISWEPTYCGGIACTDWPVTGDMLWMRYSDTVRWYANFPLPEPHPPEMDEYVDLKAFAIHEFGHALGLDDNDEPTSIMYRFIANNKHSLSADDIAAIQEIYGRRP